MKKFPHIIREPITLMEGVKRVMESLGCTEEEAKQFLVDKINSRELPMAIISSDGDVRLDGEAAYNLWKVRLNS